jgi:hypothetical protein
MIPLTQPAVSACALLVDLSTPDDSSHRRAGRSETPRDPYKESIAQETQTATCFDGSYLFGQKQNRRGSKKEED